MPITITITDPTPEQIAALFGTAAAPAAKAVVVEKTPPVAKKVEAPKAEPIPEAPVEPAEDRAALLKSLAMKYAQANGREALVSLFAEYGATNPSTVPADQTDAVIARLQE